MRFGSRFLQIETEKLPAYAFFLDKKLDMITKEKMYVVKCMKLLMMCTG